MSCFYYEKGVISHDKILFFFFQKKEKEMKCSVCVSPPEVPGKNVMMDASVLGRSSKSEATCAEP